MSWTAYRLVYQAKSPIHIGWHTLGYIKLTRYYITGKAMWGAMTANLTRAGGLPNVSDYQGIGDILKEKILISYFYPALDYAKPLLPEFTDNGLVYGDYAEDRFERLFIKSYGQTAVLPDTNTAEDESLHESEYIAPMVEEEGIQKQVYFVGYVFMRNDAGHEWNSIKNAVKEIFVGGDRKYGWGRLRLDEDQTGDGKVPDDKIFEHLLVLNGAELKIKIEKDKPIPAHLSVNTTIKVKGDIEPLVGREWGEVKDNNGKTRIGFGQKVSDTKICWVPGSVLQEEEKTLSIGGYGILK